MLKSWGYGILVAVILLANMSVNVPCGAEEKVEYDPDPDNAEMKELEERLKKYADEVARNPDAAPGDKKEKGKSATKGGPNGPGDRAAMAARLIQNFDENKDEKLDKQELMEALSSMANQGGEPREMRKKLLEKFDADGDGTLNEQERKDAHEFMKKNGNQGSMRKNMANKFDADGDGKLNEEERAKLRDHLAKNPDQKGDGLKKKD